LGKMLPGALPAGRAPRSHSTSGRGLDVVHFWARGPLAASGPQTRNWGPKKVAASETGNTINWEKREEKMGGPSGTTFADRRTGFFKGRLGLFLRGPRRVWGKNLGTDAGNNKNRRLAPAGHRHFLKSQKNKNLPPVTRAPKERQNERRRTKVPPGAALTFRKEDSWRDPKSWAKGGRHPGPPPGFFDRRARGVGGRRKNSPICRVGRFVKIIRKTGLLFFSTGVGRVGQSARTPKLHELGLRVEGGAPHQRSRGRPKRAAPRGLS